MPIKKIVIVGDGIAAWMTASALARTLNNVVTIQVVRTTGVDDSLGVPTTAEASLPSLVIYHHELGYDEDALLVATGGSFSLGVAISDWAAGAPVFNPYGEVGAKLGQVNFHHLLLRLRAAGQQLKLSNYSLAALCAQAGRFARPSPDGRSVLSVLDYALHIDVAAYTQAMKADAVARGVRSATEVFSHATVDEDGLIDAVMTAQGECFAGDLFIDCTGPRRLLANIHDVQFEDWSQWLPCDRISSSLQPTSEAPPPFTHLIAQPAGWVRTIALRGKCNEAYSFNHAAIAPAVPVDAHAFTAGRCVNPWKNNCVALGGAAAVIDPASNLSLHLLHSSIQRLISLVPNERSSINESIEFNRQATDELACARDYAILPYKLNARVGDAFWDQCRAMPVPDSLMHRIALYESCARVALHDGEVVDATNWVALLDAQAIYPRQYDVAAHGLPVDVIQKHLVRMRDVMLNAVSTLPSHQSYLSQLSTVTHKQD